MSAIRHACPTCRRELEWDAANRWRPFCSERCRIIDLGAWLKEEHAIPGEPQAAEAVAELPEGSGATGGVRSYRRGQTPL